MNLIVAADENWGIGYQGTQPIVIPEDRKYFRELTNGKTVVVGRKTLEDFPGGKPLPKRRNIVVTRDKSLVIEGAETVSDIIELFRKIYKLAEDEVFIIGGDSIYKLFTKYCQYAYVTKIKADMPADAFFENLDQNPDWELIQTSGPKNHEGIEYEFAVYENKNVKKI